MRARPFLLLGIALLLCPSPAWAQVKSPADVLPERTIGYLELRQPAALAKEIAALLKGSYLENVPDSLAPLKAKFPPVAGVRYRGPDEGTIAGIMFGPELLAELGRVKGGAIAITGLDKEAPQLPEYIIIVQPGESNAPGFMMRMAKIAAASGYGGSDGVRETMVHTGYERVEEVEGIAIYRMKRRVTIIEKGAKPETKESLIHEAPALATLPDALLIGSAGLVKDVIRRAKGKGEGESLASLEIFQKAQKDVSDKANVFAFANPGPALDLIEKIEERGVREAMAVIKQVVNPKAFLSVADQLSLDGGTLHYRRKVALDPKEKSPLLEILPRGGVSRDLLRFIAPDSMGFFVIANDEGDKRFRRVLDLADTIAKAAGQKELPSEAVAGLEKNLGIDLMALSAKIRGAAVCMPGPEQLMEGDIGHEPPFCALFEIADAKTATELAEETIPKIFAMIVGAKVEPTTEKNRGQTVSVLKTGKGGPQLAYARAENTLILSHYGSAVADALGQAKKKGLLGNEKIAKRLDELKNPVALAMIRPVALSAIYVASESKAEPPRPKIDPKFDKEDPKPKLDPEGLVATGGKEAEAAAMKAMLELLKLEEPLLLSVSRTPEHLMAEATYPGLRQLAPRLINFALEIAAQENARRFERPKFKEKFEEKK